MSLKGDKYETTEEIRFRLEGTVVSYDNRPVYISRVQVPDIEDEKEIARVFFFELPYGGIVKRGVPAPKETRKYLSSKKFDLTPLKLGYFNYLDQAVFASRAPVRQNKQGLCRNTCTFTDPRGRRDDGMNFETAIGAEGFVNMIDGKYPSFKEAGDMIGDKAMSSVAVSRSFAFVIENDLDALILVHKGLKCGIALKGDKALKIPPKFHFLKEEMEACRIPLA